MTPAIEISNLTKIYKIYNRPKDRIKEAINLFGRKYHKPFFALDDVSMEIEKGETVGIVGPNGSGKSTLLKILTGVLTPTLGNVKVDGKVSALLELGAGFNPEMTGMENIYLNGTLMGYSKKEMDDRLEGILTFADIGDFVFQPVKMYSSGMFVRLAFSVATNVNPDILIVDEALSVGDTEFQLKCINKMKDFKAEGKTILYVSHDTYSIRNFCNKAIWLKNGKVHKYGDVNEITREYDDFMKFGLTVKDDNSVNSNKNNILTIDQVYFMDTEYKTKTDFEFGEKVIVAIDITINSPVSGIVGGVAVFNNDNTYICGLNTKLDQYQLPGEPGKYKILLTYDEINLLPGTYTIDVGFFESTGIVRLDYKNKINSFTIFSNKYFGEGLTFIKHNWQVEKLGS